MNNKTLRTKEANCNTLLSRSHSQAPPSFSDEKHYTTEKLVRSLETRLELKAYICHIAS